MQRYTQKISVAFLAAMLNFCVRHKNKFILGCFVFAVQKQFLLVFQKVILQYWFYFSIGHILHWDTVHPWSGLH